MIHAQSHRIGLSLRIGLWTSIVLLIMGLVLTGFEGPSARTDVSLSDLPRMLLTGQTNLSTGTVFLYAGLLVLVLTPLFRIGTTALLFLRLQEYRFFTMSLLIFVILVVELVFALT